VGTSETYQTTQTQLARIAWLSSRDSTKRFNCLMHYFNEESLNVCFHELDGKKAVGIDGINKSKYASNLEGNIKNLVDRMKQMSHRPQAVKQVLIPKDGRPNEHRSLGISSFEDKLVQKMMLKILESIYEPLFLECSYGFRPGRSCHDAIRALQNHLYSNHVRRVIDIDLQNFFGTIDRTLLVEMLQTKIEDKRFIRYLKRMFKAGILIDGECKITEEGVVQGSMVSPILSNIYAHYVIDEWFETTVKRHCRGDVKLFRYCDDAVICCQNTKDAERIKQALKNRLAKFKLKMNEEKTKIVSYSKWDYQRGIKQGSFDFLGFTFYWGHSIKGSMIPKLKTSGKRMTAKLKRVKEWAKAVKDSHRLPVIWEIFCSKLRGHIQYYGVSHNGKRVKTFVKTASMILFKWLNRRSQKKSFTWEKFWLFVKANPVPKVKIYHQLFS
jgi:RNA-directed DNA polymerase